MRFHICLLLGLLAVAASGAEAQLVIAVKDVPFSATWTRITKVPSRTVRTPTSMMGSLVANPPPGALVGPQAGESRLDPAVNPFSMVPPGSTIGPAAGHTVIAAYEVEHKESVARASDGSLYRATYVNGALWQVEIDDVVHDLRIILHPDAMQYSIEHVPRGTLVTRTLDQERAYLERTSGDNIRKGHPETMVQTGLGTKSVNGMTIYGHHFVKAKGKTSTEEGDVWLSDLGFVYASNTKSLWSKSETTLTLEGIKREEPMRSLFVVPAGYKKITLDKGPVIEACGSGVMDLPPDAILRPCTSPPVMPAGHGDPGNSAPR